MDMPAVGAILEVLAFLIVGTYNSVLVTTMGVFVLLFSAFVAAREGVMCVEFSIFHGVKRFVFCRFVFVFF